MDPQEYPVRHFESMAELAAELRTVPAQVLEHAYHYSAFGSWWTTLRRTGIAFRIVFDGKEGQLRLEQAGRVTEAESWEALHTWQADDGESAHVLREVVARLRAV
jgi:hypothetical protein